MDKKLEMRIYPRLALLGAAQDALSGILHPNKYASQCVHNANLVGKVAESGMCMAAQREITQDVAGPRYDRYFYLRDARGSYNALKNSQFVVKDGTTAPGDMLFYMGIRHGIHGHVTRRIYGNLEYEVSSRYGKRGDCRGIQKLGFLGKPSLVVRFP